MREPQTEYDIRGDFVLMCFDCEAAGDKLSWVLIKARDDQHRALNAEYKFRELDGSVPIGCRSHTDAAYKARYEAIEADFKPQYERLWQEREAIRRANKMTIFEYLLLDNVSRSEMQEPFAASIEKQEGGYYLIKVRAREEIKKWVAGRSIKDADRVVPMLLHLSSYAPARCRQFFGLSVIDFSAWRVMRSYQQGYRSALQDALEELVVVSRRHFQ